jgi:hypothetical protein
MFSYDLVNLERLPNHQKLYEGIGIFKKTYQGDSGKSSELAD